MQLFCVQSAKNKVGVLPPSVCIQTKLNRPRFNQVYKLKMKFPPFEHHLIQNRLYSWTSSDVLIKDIKVIFQHHQAILARKEIHLLFWDSGLKKVQPVIKAMTGYDNRRQPFFEDKVARENFVLHHIYMSLIYLYIL